ncbi:MAG TPA: sulfatase-like hydrolase/transferase [Sandaracinaceae bacterium LLY-WYZ-13_1]|nr:sulfatase-like hydrolase/transferase [Sandaracinaceae bacterium LLY-WYZ-13_1]
MADSPENDETLQDYGPPASMTDHAGAEGGDDATVTDEVFVDEPKKVQRSWKKWALLVAKVAVSVYGLHAVWTKVLARDGAEEILGHLGNLHWGWFVGAMGMQLVAIVFAIFRWQTMLRGQGIEATWKFAFPSFMIGRFWGAFTLGGLGLDGWKLFDVGYHTKKYARAVAVTGTEKVLGQLAFGLVVMGASIWGLEFIGTDGVIMVNVFFVLLVGTGLTFLAKPGIFRKLFGLLPRQVQPKLQTLIDAVCAYHGKGLMLAQAVGFGVAVHSFNNLIYVCAARAVGVDLSVGLVFFASSLQIMVTLVPISINGVGLREAAAVALYTTAAVGLSESQAVLIPTVGFAAEMLVSITGTGFLFARKLGHVSGLEVVEDADREERLYEELPEVPPERWPSKARGLSIGAGAGLLAGMIVGMAEGAVIVADGGGRVSYGVMAYGAVAYGVFCAIGGAAGGFVLAWLGRKMKREAVPEPQAYGQMTALMVAALAFALSVFRIRRDVFHEELALKSKEGLMVLGGCALAAALLYFLLAFLLRLWTQHKVGSFMLRAWGSPAFVAVIVAAVGGSAVLFGQPAAAEMAVDRPAPPEDAPNVLFIVVDTLRADHLPAYGYDNGATPHLDRFAEDAVRYDQAFSNASWTRPSFASILTGRHASSHGVMGKPDALPGEITTLPEALRAGGYATAGWVTNFNVGPYFNFQQGFDEYRFLEPEFVLGADDAAAKLLLVQALRQTIERVRALRGSVEPGTAYQDAETVNRHLTAWLDRAPTDTPWFAFVGYMDPHDPYFPHPYDGTGYARAAHQHPDPSEADELRALYDGEITYWDEHFGALMDDLRRRGLYDDTLIVVTSDHGEEFAEHGGFWHGTTLYDEQVHVPLFVKLPGNQRAGTHVSHWVQSIDLMPSLLTRVGLEIPEGVQGGSLEEGSTRVYAEESHEGNVLESIRELRDFEELKLITANPDNPRGLEAAELYRVADDPGEQENLADAERERVRALMSSLDEARQQAAEGAVEGSEVEVDEDSRRRLCQIGYIDAEICCREGLLSGEPCRGT